MFNSATPPPNTPPTTKPTQDEQDAVNSLLELRHHQGHAIHNGINVTALKANIGINSPVNSPVENTTRPDALVDHNAAVLGQISRNNHQAIHTSIKKQTSRTEQESVVNRYGLILLPPLQQHRESAVRSTLDHSLPAFNTIFHKQDEQLQNSCHIQLENFRQPQKVNSYQIIRDSQSRYNQHPDQVAQAQTQAHAQAQLHAQAYYLAQSQLQAYGLSQQGSTNLHTEQQVTKEDDQHQQPKKQPVIMNHHVRAVESRLNPLPWPEPNSNRNRSLSNPNSQSTMQNSFSINGDGVRVRRTIVSGRQFATISAPPGYQYKTPHAYNSVVVTNPPQQVVVTADQNQQPVVVFRKQQEAQIQQTTHDQGNLDKLHGRSGPSRTILLYHPIDPLQMHHSNNFSMIQQAGHQRDMTLHQQQMYQQGLHQLQHKHQQYSQSIYQPSQQQQLQKPSLQSSYTDINKAMFQQSVRQGKVVSRQQREVNANSSSLFHRVPHQQQKQQEHTCSISPATTSSDTLITEEEEEEEEDHEMYEEGEEDYNDANDDDDDDDAEDEEGASASDPDSQGSSNNNADKKPTKTSSKKGKTVKEKPRWTPQLREALLKAVISFKNLDDMTSFHWSQIGKQVGRSGKACKDQWRRALLPKIQQTFDHYEPDYASSFTASSQQHTNKD